MEMGVQGLLKYILSTPSAREKVQLRQFAKAHLKKTGKQPELLCDFYSVVKWLLSSYDYAVIEREVESPYCLLHGGVFKHYTDRVLSFVRTIKSLGLAVVFCIESTLIAKEEMDVLYDAYATECGKSMQDVSSILQICTSNLDMTQVQWAWWEGVASHVIFVLESAPDVRVMYCEGRSLAKAVSYMQSNKHVCGILSDNTSFAIASGCGLFLIDLFELDVHQPVPALPSLELDGDLSCEVVWSTWLASSLDLTMQQLADLAILSGNEYTSFLNKKLHLPETLGITGMGVTQTADWLRTQDARLSNISTMEDFLMTNPNYQKAIQLSYRIYLDTTQVLKSDKLLKDFPLLEEIVSNGGLLSPEMVSVVSSCMYWRATLIEPQTPNCPHFSDVTLIIRMYVYSLLGLSQVLEYGFVTASTFLAQIPVDVVSSSGSTKLLTHLSTNEQLGILHDLLTCPCVLETPEDFRQVIAAAAAKGQKVSGVISAAEVLLFACLVFMRDSNMRIMPIPNILICELDALLTTVLCSLAGLPPLQLIHIPPPKGVTVASWFSHLLDQVYWLASCLGLSRDLPPPGQLFTAHQYVLFHLASVLWEDFSDESFPPVCSRLKRLCDIYQEIWELGPVLDLRAEMLDSTSTTSLSRIAELFSDGVDAVSSSSTLRESFNELSFPPPPSPSPASPPNPKQGGGEEFQMALDDYTTSSGEFTQFLIQEELSHSQERSAAEENQFFSSQSLCEMSSDLQGVESCEEEEEEFKEEDINSYFDDEWSELEDGGGSLIAFKEGGDGGVAPSTADSAKLGNVEKNEDRNSITQSGASTIRSKKDATIAQPPVKPSKRKKLHPPKTEPKSELPIMAHRSHILELVRTHTVICIEGETGCGKSTKVPQFILDESRAVRGEESSANACRILVTQPRRVAAIKLAERVSAERGVKLGTTVGYCVGGDHHRVARTALTYCTIGYLLQVRKKGGCGIP